MSSTPKIKTIIEQSSRSNNNINIIKCNKYTNDDHTITYQCKGKIVFL